MYYFGTIEYLLSMNKNKLSDILGTTLEEDVALNNTITVQAKFKLCEEQEFILYSIMEHLTHCRFIYFNLFVYPHKMDKFIKENSILVTKKVKNKETNKIENIQLKETFKVTFCRVYGISSRQFNSIDFVVKGLIQSNKTLIQDRLISFNDQLRKKINKMDKLKGQINLLKISDAYLKNDEKIIKSCKEKQEYLHKLNHSIEQKKHAIEKLEKKIKGNKINVCFGDRKVLNRLSSLFNDSNYDKGKYKNISPLARKSYQKSYRKLWNDSRYNQFFLLGSKDENNGNSSCVFSKLNESSYSAKISIPIGVQNKLSLKCKYLTIDNINFKHNEKEILNSFALNNERKLKEQEYNQKVKDNCLSLFDEDNKLTPKSKYLENYGVAMSFRFIKDVFKDPKRKSNDWRILVSMDETNQQKAIVSKSNGVIGIDINVDHYSVADINRSKELNKAFKVKFGFTDNKKNSNSTVRKEEILKSVKQIIKYALEFKKPIVIEKLDFKRKKALLKEEENIFNKSAAKKKNRILSSFAYRLMIEKIKILAYRNGIAVYEVNPAYTSQIGYIKYAKKYGISRHMAAAYVIGRRTYGIEELFERTEQVIVKNQIKTISLLEDRETCANYYEYCNRNLKGFQKRLVSEDRGKKPKKTQIANSLVIPILPLDS